MRFRKFTAVLLSMAMVGSTFVSVDASADETTDDYSSYDYDSSYSDYSSYDDDSSYSDDTSYDDSSYNNGSDDNNSSIDDGNADDGDTNDGNDDNAGNDNNKNTDTKKNKKKKKKPSVNYSKIKLSKRSMTLVAADDWYYYATGKIPLRGISKKAKLSYSDISSVEGSNSSMYVSDLEIKKDKNKKYYIYFNIEGTGRTTVSFYIGTKKLSFKVNIEKPVQIYSRSYLLAKGGSVKLRLKGSTHGAKVTYKSLSPSVASISSNGAIKAKRCGTAVMRVKVYYSNRTVTLGTAVNVASANRVAIYKWDRAYAGKNKYSQAKRMLKGYYDCSSLVWRAYRSRGFHLLYKKIAPTAADLAKYLVGKRKAVGYASYKNFQSRRFMVGDLLFETGAKNKRYKGIYHVEMFGGYTFDYFDSKGKPVLGINFANRGDDNSYYGVDSSNFLCRP